MYSLMFPQDPFRAGMGGPCHFCGRPGRDVCPVCGEVWSCCPAHLRLHNRGGDCFPYRVDRMEGVGRMMVATRDLAAGDTIFQVI